MKIKTCALLCFYSIVFAAKSFAGLISPGFWRFELEATHGKIPFIMEIHQNQNQYFGTLLNGKEKIKLGNFKFKADSLEIKLQNYEASLNLKIMNPQKLQGHLIRLNKNPPHLTPIVGFAHQNIRFPEEKKKPTINLSGRWQVKITDEQNKTQTGVLIFEQNDHLLKGSLLTPTGDYRYMEGFVSADQFETASFDGVYNYIIKDQVSNGELAAQLLANYKLEITGKKNDHASLPDAYSQTQIDKLDFSFTDLYGNKVSISNPKYKGKAIIVAIFGSWCPNCLDELNYLIPWYHQNRNRGIEIILLAFERSLSQEAAKLQLKKTTRKFKIPFTVLLAGSTPEDKPQRLLPGLKNFISFPTTVYLDKNHRMKKVHAGFNGPGTGEFFISWQKEFNETVNGLLRND